MRLRNRQAQDERREAIKQVQAQRPKVTYLNQAQDWMAANLWANNIQKLEESNGARPNRKARRDFARRMRSFARQQERAQANGRREDDS